MAPKNKKEPGKHREGSEESIGQPARSKMYKAPGRLGDPRMEISQDPRASVKLREILGEYGLDQNPAPPSLAILSAQSSMSQMGASMAEAQAGFEKLYESLPNNLPADAFELPVEESLQLISGPGNRDIKLHIFRPELRGGPLPGVLFFHGGGMTIMKTMNKVNRRWCTSLAAQGMVVIAVDFRNAWLDGGHHPFPAGLDDCCASVKWIHSHKVQLDIRNIVLQGENGGANLALATALKGNREGWGCKIDGVYACSPYISNAYSWPEERRLAELPSLIECNGYFCNVNYQAYMAFVYTPKSEDHTNPLAWPYHASKQDMEGLPPHVLVMDELDPMRDEGVAYYRKLSAAGVRCVGQVSLGHTAGASVVFRQTLAEDNRIAIRNIVAFAKSV